MFPKTTLKLSVLLAVTCIVGAGLTGCSDNQMTGTVGHETQFTAASPPPTLSAPRPEGVLGTAANGTWTVVASTEIDEDGGTVTGGRFSLYFSKDAVSDDTDITISTWDEDVLDVEFGPHGTDFSRLVRCTVDYSGTNADPDSPNYDGTVPAFYWFNPATDTWYQFEGKNDVSHAKYYVYLSHFSRYALGAKPGPGDGTADW